MEIYSIGFTKKTAAEFFGKLKAAGIRRLLDVRLNNVSQLAGFTKRDDLRFFLKEICGAEYRHEPLLAPKRDILDGYRKKKLSWDDKQLKNGNDYWEREMSKWLRHLARHGYMANFRRHLQDLHNAIHDQKILIKAIKKQVTKKDANYSFYNTQIHAQQTLMQLVQAHWELLGKAPMVASFNQFIQEEIINKNVTEMPKGAKKTDISFLP